jgi:hypothetical protein
MTRRRDLTIAGIALGIAVAAGVATLVIFAVTRGSPTILSGGSRGVDPVAAGQVIFRTGRGPNGGRSRVPAAGR